MSYLDWHVGMKVVCVKGANPAVRGNVSNRGEKVGKAENANFPEHGIVYTVRHINPIDADYVLILLEEVRNDHLQPFIRGGLEPGFDAKYFRPVQKRSTDISALKALLLNPFVKIGEDA